MSWRSVLAAALLVLWPCAAGAYVFARNDVGEPTSWRETTCVGITPDAALDAPGLDPATIMAVLQRSVDAWSGPTAGCSYFTVRLMPPRSGERVGYDPAGINVNLVQLVTQGWRHDAEAAAITTMTFSPTSGRMYDADIEVNSQYFRFGVVDASGGSASVTDLENTLVHELGHLVGLDHTCDDGAREYTPIDHLGQIIPPCCPESDPMCQRNSAAEYLRDFPEIVEATMFNFAPPGETKKRSPEPDDVAGYCALYPREDAPAACVPEYDASSPGGGGCALAGPAPSRHAAGTGLVLVLLTMAGLFARGLARRPRRPDRV